MPNHHFLSKPWTLGMVVFLVLTLSEKSSAFDISTDYTPTQPIIAPNRPSRGIASDSKSQQVQKCIQENLNIYSVDSSNQVVESCERFADEKEPTVVEAAPKPQKSPYGSADDCMKKNSNDENYCNQFNYEEQVTNGFPKSPYADAIECMAKNNYDQDYCNKYDYGELNGKGAGAVAKEPGDPTPPPSPESQSNLCTQAHATAMNDCDTERQSWMKNIQMVAQGLGPVMEAGACGKLAAANVGASTSLATFKVMCSNSSQACLSECAKPSIPSEMEDMRTKLTECRKKGTKAAEAEQAAAQGTQQLLSAVATCKTAFGVDSNPFNINNDPYQGKTTEEIMAGLQPGQAGGSLDYSGSKGSGGATGNSGFDLSGLEQDEEIGKPKAGAKSAGGAIGGSMGSAGMGGGGGAGVDAGGGGSGGGKRPAGLLSNILSGFFGGAGGGGLFGGTGRGKGGLSGFFGEAKPQAEKMPDLRQFMPGGALDPRKARGLAGQKISADGMSGPHGNIWRMINNRYQYKKASLLP